MNEVIKDRIFDEERALYNIENTKVLNCTFAGVKDGESVLKEIRNCEIENCKFSLRYPLWHAKGFQLLNSKLDELVRAPLWYAIKGRIDKTEILGIKCLRECDDIQINDCNIVSKEFGWRCRNLKIENTKIESEYFLFESKDININNLNMKGKYSFQYVDGGVINDSILDTKDAFWHSKNLIVTNCQVIGEYLGWFSENLTLINCYIKGTQPLCYCENLKLIDCVMENTDLSFEYSDVEATIKGNVISIKNPKSGTITCDSVSEIIHDHTVIPCNGIVIVKEKSD